MFANLDRETFIALLDKLGSEDEAEVLSAARDLHAKVTVAGVSWDTLLAPEGNDEDGEDGEDDDAPEGAPRPAGANDDADDAGLVAPDADHGVVDEAEKSEARALIEAIGALKISSATREELADYKRDLDEGGFEKMDLRYLRALHKRLAK